MNANAEDPKVAKKRAKAAAKAAKKGLHAPQSVAFGDGKSPAERAAAAAERQVALQRWRVILGIVGALIAIATFLIMWNRS